MRRRRATRAATFVNPKRLPEPEDWLRIDTILIKQYNLRPWELDELTITECAWMLLALRQEEDETLTLAAGQDPGMQHLIQQRIDEEISRKVAYGRLTPAEKLERALQAR